MHREAHNSPNCAGRWLMLIDDSLM